MADTETTKHKPVVQVDHKKPFFIVFYQTETRNVSQVVQTENSQKDAEDIAASLARSAKRTVLVIGPQRAAFAPPLEVTKDTFDF